MMDTWFHNLGLAKILDYNDLLRKPTSLGCFDNDIGFVSGKSNLIEYCSANDQVMVSLGIGNVGRLDTHSFELEGNDLEMDYLNIMSCLSLDIEGFDQEKVLVGMCHDINGKMCWCKLPEAIETNNEKRGIVRQHNVMRYDEEGTYTTKALKDVETAIMDTIANIRTDIDEVHALIA